MVLVPRSSSSVPPARPTTAPTSVLPGIAFCLVAALLALGVQQLLPAVSALLVAILLGIVTANVVRLPETLRPGIAISAKRLLRLGIVLLGLSLALDDIFGLGWPVLLVVVAVVTLGLVGTVVLGRLVGVGRAQSVLIAAGFSICGAAAVAAVEGTIEREDEEVANAIGLVVVFGTAMIGLAPAALALTGLAPEVQGLIAGGAIHEVAQVVAAGGIIGGGALAVAVVVKLARVLMLAPVILVLGLVERRRTAGAPVAGTARPPLVPLFVAGFVLAACVRTFVPLPDVAFDVAKTAQVILLSAAMFALGLGVSLAAFRRAGVRPILLGALSTTLVATVATTGMLWVA